MRRKTKETKYCPESKQMLFLLSCYIIKAIHQIKQANQPFLMKTHFQLTRANVLKQRFPQFATQTKMDLVGDVNSTNVRVGIVVSN